MGFQGLGVGVYGFDPKPETLNPKPHTQPSLRDLPTRQSFLKLRRFRVWGFRVMDLGFRV